MTNNASALVPSAENSTYCPRALWRHTALGTGQLTRPHIPALILRLWLCSLAAPESPPASPWVPLVLHICHHLSCSVPLKCHSLKSPFVLSYILRWSLFWLFGKWVGIKQEWRKASVMIQTLDDNGLDKVKIVAMERNGQMQDVFCKNWGLADGIGMNMRNPIWFLVSSLSNWGKHSAIYCHRKCWRVGRSFGVGLEIKRILRHVNFTMFQANINWRFSENAKQI